MEDLFYLAAILIVILFVISCFIHCIYRCCKWCCCKTKNEEHSVQVNAILIQDYQEICQLPKAFGKNAKLYTVTNNLDRGIKHVYARHSSDFASEADIVKSLKKNLTSSKLLGEEADSRGNRYVWKSNDKRNGGGTKQQQLVTILSPRNGDFELITAYKR